MSFSTQLKKGMEQRNMNQAELSALTGIGKSSISQYLSGKNVPKEKTIEKLSEALECSVDFLNGLITDDIDGLISFKKVSVAEAAKRINKSEQYVRVGLQRERLPFGTAVKMSSRWSYHISPKLLDAYIGVAI